MKRKLYLVKKNEVYSVVRAVGIPPRMVSDRFEGIEPDKKYSVACFDIIEDAEGVKAVFNQAKADAERDSAIALQNQRFGKAQIKNDKISELKSSLPTFDSKPASQKWDLVKKLIEVL